MSHKSKENVNELRLPLKKRKYKSAFDQSTSSRKPMTDSQSCPSTCNHLESTSNSKRLKQSFQTQSRHLSKDSSQNERQKSSDNLSNAVKSTLKCLSKNSNQRQVQRKQKSNEKSCPLTTDIPSSSMSNFCQVSCNNLSMEPKRSLVGQLTFDDTFRRYIEEQQTLLNQNDSPTTKKKPKGSKIKEDSPKSIENDQSKFQRGRTREVTTKKLKLDDSNPQTNNVNVVLQPPKETKFVYTSRLIDGRIKITRRIKHDKTDQKESKNTNESDTTKQIEIQTINDDVIQIKNEAQVSPELCDVGVQTDPPTRNTLCDFASQTIFPDTISESLSSVKELRQRISELEQNLTQCNVTQHRCNESPSTLIQVPFNQLAANLTTVRPQNIPSSSPLHGIKHSLPSLVTTPPQPMNLSQLPASRPGPCATSMCVPGPFMIVPQPLMVRPKLEKDNFQQALSPSQQRYTHPLQLSALSNHQNKTWHQQHYCAQQYCACRQCFQHRQPQLSLHLQNASQLSSTPSEKSVQSLHQNESAHQLLRQQQLTN